MREIGGYIELDTYHGNMRYENAIKLNCAKNAFAYLILHKGIKKIHIPFFLCDSLFDICVEYGVEMVKYHLNANMTPVFSKKIEGNDWIYLVNYYGQLSTDIIIKYKKEYPNLIVDNVQAYYSDPIEGIDTFYSCRKFFGVADGAILCSNINADDSLPIDESYSRMLFLLGRYERSASEFYDGYVSNNKFTRNASIMRMSKLTENLLHGIDYECVKKTRTINYNYLRERLDRYNQLPLMDIEGAFSYPLYIENGNEVRKKLIDSKIYIPILWPNVLKLEMECIDRDMFS